MRSGTAACLPSRQPTFRHLPAQLCPRHICVLQAGPQSPPPRRQGTPEPGVAAKVYHSQGAEVGPFGGQGPGEVVVGQGQDLRGQGGGRVEGGMGDSARLHPGSGRVLDKKVATWRLGILGNAWAAYIADCAGFSPASPAAANSAGLACMLLRNCAGSIRMQLDT